MRVILAGGACAASPWLGYWRNQIAGEPIMTATLPVELVLVSVLVFVAVLIFARIHDLFGRPESGAENDGQLYLSEPNRRNQNATPLCRTAKHAETDQSTVGFGG